MLKLNFKVVEDQTLFTKQDQRKRYEGLPTLLHRTVQFYTPRLTPSLKNTKPDSSAVPSIMTSEVKKTLKKEKQQGPRHR